MSKLQQLEHLRDVGASVPPFIEITYADYQSNSWSLGAVKFPVAVRSTYSEEDGDEQSFAGHFHTELNVENAQISEAIGQVFTSYPVPEGQSVIVQTMLHPSHSGVLFAYREGVWWTDWAEGLGEQVVSGQVQPRVSILPRFSRLDAWMARYYSFWEPAGLPSELRPAFVALSDWAGRLLAQRDAPHGLDIEFCVENGQLYLLQARPITTPDDAQQLLSSANHKEILPAQPSTLMTSLIVASGHQLYAYYQRLDASLRSQPFILPAAGMPWINLSALYDTMTHWGLPTSLVAQSVGAEDVYALKLRPWRVMTKLLVFLRVFLQQQTVHRSSQNWIKDTQEKLTKAQATRQPRWKEQPAEATKDWIANTQAVYVGLVEQMQVLTGAMSGPLAALKRLDWIHDLAAYPSKSADYMRAYQALSQGRMTLGEFLQDFGHRGFYESDLGRPRFREWSEAQWQRLLGDQTVARDTGSVTHPAWYRRPLLAYAAKLVHRREWIRHESMRIFDHLRQELQTHYPQGDPWSMTIRQLVIQLEAADPGSTFGPLELAEPEGWDMDTFLCNQLGRRLAIEQVLPSTEGNAPKKGLGIYPGQIKGQIWRVKQADINELDIPDFANIILLADALDPGWIPYFNRVKGVAAYTGGLLSHASIILREARLPAVTQLPVTTTFSTGDWVLLDGQKGTLEAFEPQKA